jgi:capsular polysaccharide biosynthesis protein
VTPEEVGDAVGFGEASHRRRRASLTQASYRRAAAMKRLLIGLGLAVIVGTVAFWWLAPVRYEVYALLRVAQRQQHVLNKGGEGVDEFQTFKRTQVQLILSPFVLQRAVREPKIANLATIKDHKDEPHSWLKEQLIINYPDDSEILRVSMKGTKPSDMVEIVNMVVKKYLSEIVQNERIRRVAKEDELRKYHDDYQRELAAKMDALHNMEKIAKVGSTQTAQIAKKLAVAKLDEAIARRARIRVQLDDNAMQTELLKAREEEGKRTAETEPSPGVPAPASLTAHQLAVQKEYLEQRLMAAENDVTEQAELVENLESFSANVANKQTEVARLRHVTEDLGAELERSRIERLAMERITKVDDAILSSSKGDAARKNVCAAVMGLLGVSLLLFGVVIPRRTK